MAPVLTSTVYYSVLLTKVLRERVADAKQAEAAAKQAALTKVLRERADAATPAERRGGLVFRRVRIRKIYAGPRTIRFPLCVCAASWAICWLHMHDKRGRPKATRIYCINFTYACPLCPLFSTPCSARGG